VLSCVVMNIYRSINEPKRTDLSWEELWSAQDKGAIIAWEIGREQGIANPDLAEKVLNGELPVLGLKGGVVKKLKQSQPKVGSFLYLAKLQGIRGEDLDINLGEEITLTCSKTGQVVFYTSDTSKLSEV
jgi:hypothetical protein